MGKNNTTNFVVRAFRFLHKWFNNHIIWFAVLLFGATVWLSLISVMDFLYIEIPDGEKQFSLGGWVSVIIAYVILITTFVTKEIPKKDDRAKEIDKKNMEIKNMEIENAFFRSVLKLHTSMDVYTFKKLKRIINPNISYNYNASFFMEHLLEQIKNFVKIPLEQYKQNYDVDVTLMYKMEGHRWRFLDDADNVNALTAEQLETYDNTSFNMALKSKGQYFENDKMVASGKGEYYYDSKDNEYGREGSIACYYYSVSTNNDMYIESVLSICTYGLKFVPDNKDGNIDRDNKKGEKIYEDNLYAIMRYFLEDKIRCILSMMYQDKIQKYSTGITPPDTGSERLSTNPLVFALSGKKASEDSTDDGPARY